MSSHHVMALEAEWVRTRERADALRRDLDLMVESADGGADDEHDPEGTTAFDRAQTRALLTAATAMLAEIDQAAERVTAGTYGICECCGQAIPVERLHARPVARTCVACAAPGHGSLAGHASRKGGCHMKRIGVVLCIGSMVSSAAVVGTGAARADSGTTCSVKNPVTLTPGVSLQGSTGTFESKTIGTVTCDGPVNGVKPTGPGTFLDKGNYGTQDPDDCLGGGEGTGSYTMVFPTARGKKTVVLAFTLEFGAPSTQGGLIGIHTKGDGFVGEFGGTPTAGDCVTAPVTKVLALGTIVLS